MKYLFVFIATYFLISCQSELPENKSIEVLNFIDSLIIPIDETIPHNPGVVDYLGDENLLAITNTQGRSIMLFDLNEKSLAQNIEFEREGPNGVSYLFAMSFASKDTIVILDGYRGIKLSDREGNILLSSVMTSAAGNFIPVKPILAGNNLVAYSRGPIKAFNVDNFLNKANNSLAITFHTVDSTQNQWLSYPETFGNDTWVAQHLWFYPTYNKASNQLIFANAGSDSIWVMEGDRLQNQKQVYFGTQSFIAPTKYTTGMPGQNTPVEQEDMDNWFIKEASAYGAIHFDEFSHLYYRLISLPNPSGTSIAEKPMGLLVANEDFSEIKEFRLPPAIEHELAAGSFFTTQDGLYLFNGDINESHWKWYLFRPADLF
ncbi:DUF4221 family protein [Peijinzhouia sedimentorum]